MNSKTTTAFTIVLGLMITSSFGEPDAREWADRRPEITIRVYDYAATPASTVGQMKGEVERILGLSGARVIWLNCRGRDHTDRQTRCAASSGALELMLRIRRSPASDGLLGMNAQVSSVRAAWTPVGGKVVTVFLDAAERLIGSRGDSDSLGTILAYITAHEVGHAFGLHHSPDGIMKPHFSSTDVRQMMLRQLFFSPQSREGLRRGITHRLAAARAKTAKDFIEYTWQVAQ